MTQNQYLLDKGTDKLIADVRAYKPANMAEQDEVPEMFDEFTGPCDTRPCPVAGNVNRASVSKPDSWTKTYIDAAHTIGFQSGLIAAINAIFADDEIRTSDKARLAETLAKIGPAGSTR